MGDPASKVNLDLTKRTNLDASIRLFNISKKYKVSKFIFSPLVVTMDLVKTQNF